MARHGPWPFVTRAAGLTARAHRKGLGTRLDTWFWQPARLGWWIAWGFILGSACFMAGGGLAILPWPQSSAGLNLLFAVGAVFFTAAAWGQFLEAVNAPPSPELYDETVAARRFRFFGWRPRMIGYWASVIQWAGTLTFNVMTLDAFLPALSGWRGDALIWAPDMLGSVCFLAASWLAFLEVCHRWLCLRPRSLDWWIGVLNLAGSVAFQLSAFYAYLRPGSAQPVGPWLDNFWTFAGGACFLLAAFLLLPEMAAPATRGGHARPEC